MYSPNVCSPNFYSIILAKCVGIGMYIYYVIYRMDEPLNMFIFMKELLDFCWNFHAYVGYAGSSLITAISGMLLSMSRKLIKHVYIYLLKNKLLVKVNIISIM